MMKNIRILMICLLCAVAVCLCVLLGIFLFMGGRAGDGGGQEYSRDQEWEFPAEGISRLEVDLSYQSVYFRKAAGDEFVIRQYANQRAREGELVRVEKNGAKLLIKGWKNNSFFFSLFHFHNPDAYIEVYLPESFTGEGEELRVSTTSGEIEAELSFSTEGGVSVSSTSGNITLDRLGGEAVISSTSGEIFADGLMGGGSISTTSGDVSVEDFAGNGTVSTTSGEIFLGKVQGNMELSTTSGEISLGEVQGNMELSTTSGNITVEKGNGGFWGETSSGDVELEQWDGEVSVSTTSGEVSLALSEKGSFALDFDTVSGDCDTFFDEDLNFGRDGRQVKGQYGGGDDRIEVSTTSGDLNIKAY